MSARVILVEATPTRISDGAAVTVRLAGGGADTPYRYDGQDWRGGIVKMPTIITQLEFEGGELGIGGVPQAAVIEWSPASHSSLAELAGYFWPDGLVTVRIGPEGASPPVRISGRVLDASVDGGTLRLSLADPAAALKKPLLTARYAGTGGIEGPVEWKGDIKRRLWGRVWNVEGAAIDKANNIYCFADPTRPLQSFEALRDKGAGAAAMTSVAWAGSAAATLTALQAAVAPQGGGVAAPSIACVKWWTEPATLTADIKGEVGGGYVETAAEIAAVLVAAVAGPAFTAGTVAAAKVLRPAACGWVADNASVQVSAMLDALLGDQSLLWLLDAAGTITIRAWAWGASVAAGTSHDVARKAIIRPLATRSIGYQRNETVMARGDLAAIVLVSDIPALSSPAILPALEKRTVLIPWNAEVTARDTALVASGAALGLTGASENRLLWSEQLDHAGWDDKVGVTVTANDATYGGVLLDKLVFNGASGQRLGQITSAANAPNGAYELAFNVYSLTARDVVVGLTDGGTGGTGGTTTVSVPAATLTRVAALKSYTATAAIDRRVSLSIVGDPSSENRALWSEQFENWGHVIGCTVTANDRTEGGYVLDKLVFTATGATRIGQFGNTTDQPNAAYDFVLLVYSLSAITVTIQMYDGGTGGTGGSQNFSVPANTLTSISMSKSYTATAGIDRRYWVTVAGEVGTIWVSKAHLKRTSFGSTYLTTTSAVVSNAGGGGTIWASKAQLRRTSVSSTYLTTTSAIAIVAGDAALIALDSARSGYLGWRDALSPPWSDTTQDSAVVRATMESVRGGYTSALDGVDARIAEVANANALWSGVSGAGKPADNADVTATAQIVVVPPPDQTLNREFGGAVIAGQLPYVLTMGVTRGGVSIRTDNAVTYAMTVTGGLVGKATINTTAGHADKGRITLPDTIISAGGFTVTVSYNGTAIGSYAVALNTVDAGPPVNSGTGGGTDTSIGSMTSTSYVALTNTSGGDPLMDVTITAGQSLKGAANFQYHMTGTSGLSAEAMCKFQYSPDGTTWTDFAAAVAGGTATAVDPEFGDAIDSEIIFNQTKSGLASGTWKVRLVGAKSSSSGGGLVAISGSATSSIA